MIKNKHNLSIIIFLLFANIFSVIAKDENDMSSNPANDPKIEISILADFLNEQHYKKQGINKFKQRCLDFFGIDISLTKDDYFQCIEGVSGCYNISPTQEFLDTFGESIFYEPSVPTTPTIQDVKTKLRKKDNLLAQQFVVYNRLLFNDDTSLNSFFQDKESIDYLLEIVFQFDYEKNEVLYQSALPYIINSEINLSNNQHLLFYNNPQKGYKKRLLNDIFLVKGVRPIEAILDATYNNWEAFQTDLSRINNGENQKVTIEESVQDKALLHLIKLISYHQDKTQTLKESEQLAYTYLNKFFNKDLQLEKRLKQNNYYDMGLTILPEEKRVASVNQNELLKNHYMTESVDGYVNLRKAPNTKSEVIKRLQNNIDLAILGYKGAWYHVKLTDNQNIGYIHQSQLIYKD